MSPRLQRALLGLGIAVYLAVHAWFVVYGAVIGDEAFYLYASRSMLEGQVPYRDFLFWQPPPILFLYAIAGSVMGWTLEPMRILSTLLGAAGAAMALAIVFRRGGWTALLIAVPLFAFNLSYGGDTAIVKTQTLTIFLSMLALLVYDRGRSTAVKYALAGVLVAIAVGSRASFVPLLPCFWLLVWAESGRDARKTGIAVATTVATLAAGLAVFWLWTDGEVMYGLLGYHEVLRNQSSAFSEFYFRGMLRNQAAVLLLLVALGALASMQIVPRYRIEAMRAKAGELRYELFLLATWALVSVVHFNAPYKYPTHQTSNMPLLVMALSLAFGRIASRLGPARERAIVAAVWILAVMAAPVANVDVSKPERETQIREIRALARDLRPFIREDGTLYTTETAIAVEGGYRVIDGLNLGWYTLLGGFGMSTEECRRRHAVDNVILAEQFGDAKPDVVIIQAWDAKMARLDRNGPTFDELYALVEKNYELWREYDEFGQFNQETRVFVRRGMQSAASR